MKPETNRERSNQRKKAIRIGAATLGFFLITLVAVTVLRIGQENRAQADYRHARSLMIDLSRGKITDCTGKIDAARRSIGKQLRRTKLTRGLINKKAVIYDMVLKESLAVCQGEAPRSATDPNVCDKPDVCREDALAFVLTGRYESAATACRRGLGFREDGAMRALLALAQDLSNDLQ